MRIALAIVLLLVTAMVAANPGVAAARSEVLMPFAAE
jgi:hypothetical protein